MKKKLIPRKFVFAISLMVLILAGFISNMEITDGATAMTAVGQLSDDLFVNSASRSIVRNDTFKVINTAFLMLGVLGLGFSLVPKQKKESKKDENV